MEGAQTQIDTTAWPSSYNRKSKRVDLEKFFQQVQQECEQIEQETTEEKPKRKVVRFSTEPPTVFTYEPEYDLFERLKSSMEQSKDSWPTYARKPRKLDLRPIVNNQYSGQSPISAPCSFSTTSSSSPITSSNNTPLVSSNKNQRSYSLPTTPTHSLPDDNNNHNHDHNHSINNAVSSSSSTTTTYNSNNNNKINSPPLSPNLPNLTTSDDSSDEDDQPSPTLTLTPTNSSLPFSSTSFTKRITAVFSRKKSIGRKNNSQ